MKYPINPTVDVVFKALLGSEERKPLLINFLNAVLNPPEDQKIVQVELLNPYSEPQFAGDKVSIVDIRAQDQQRRKFQIEIQIKVVKSLAARVNYTWAKLHSSQIVKGEKYENIQQSISIWVLANNMIPKVKSPDFHHIFTMYDNAHQLELNDHCQIHTLELPKWNHDDTNIREDIDRWIYLLINGETLDSDNLPVFLQTEVMRQAVETLNYFSEDEKARAVYEARHATMLKEQSEQADMEDLKLENIEVLKRAETAEKQVEVEKQKVETERQKVDAERQKVEAERQKVEAEKQKVKDGLEREKKLLQQLKDAGIDISKH